MFLKYGKIFLLLAVFCLTEIVNAALGGEFYKTAVKTESDTLEGTAKQISCGFLCRYTPAVGKNGVLDELLLQDYAISCDQKILALAEVQEDGSKYFNRIIFYDYNKFSILNGIEFETTEKLEKIFFGREQLYCMFQGHDVFLKSVKIQKNLALSGKKLQLSAPISNVLVGADGIFIKCQDRTLLQLDDDLDVIASIQTRKKGGVIFKLAESNVMVNFTGENIERFQCSADGFFKMNFHELKNVPAPENVFLTDNPLHEIFFTSGNKLYCLNELTYAEDQEVSDFEQIGISPDGGKIYLLASKKQSVEIFDFPEIVQKKKLVHGSMRPKTSRNLKFMIPHKDGVFLITNAGEIAIIREVKRRYLKEQIR